MQRQAAVSRNTAETEVSLHLLVEGQGKADIHTGIGFFDHMLTLFTVHGLYDLTVRAKGDLEVDDHHTVEDVGLVMGDAIDRALGDRAGIQRYGFSVVPMDETLAEVAVDLSRRPFLVFNVPQTGLGGTRFDASLTKEFLRAVVHRGGFNLHVNVRYGENQHHILEAVFKAFGRALAQAMAPHPRMSGILSSKGAL